MIVDFSTGGCFPAEGRVHSWKEELSIQCCSFTFYTEIPNCIFKMVSRELPVGFSCVSWLRAVQNAKEICQGAFIYGLCRLCKCWLLNSCFSHYFYFLFSSFGKRSAGSLRRGCECIVLEPSEMIVVSPPFLDFYHASVNAIPQTHT